MLSKLAKARGIIHATNIDYRDCFNSPVGKKVLDHLKKRWLPEIITTNDPHTTAMNARGVEIINDILRRIDDGVDGRSV